MNKNSPHNSSEQKGANREIPGRFLTIRLSCLHEQFPWRVALERVAAGSKAQLAAGYSFAAVAAIAAYAAVMDRQASFGDEER
jgi:hypothetical protein